jgi:hypothetical protein
VPYTPDAGDIAFWPGNGMATAEQFEAYLRDSFDVLYAESERYPRMMSIGLHSRVIGRPGRSIVWPRRRRPEVVPTGAQAS